MAKKVDLTGVRIFSRNEFVERQSQRLTRARNATPKFKTILDPDKVNEQLHDRISITLSYGDREFFEILGDGSVSKGVKIAANLARGTMDEIRTAVLASKAIKFGEAK